MMVIAQANATLGAVKAGGSLGGNAGAGLFFNSRDYVNAGLQITQQIVGRWGGKYGGNPAQQDPPSIGGAYAGYGPGLLFTNAGSATQLTGPFQTLTSDVGIGEGKGSISIASSGSIWTVSLSGGPAPISDGIGLDYNYSTTNTKAVGTNSCP